MVRSYYTLNNVAGMNVADALATAGLNFQVERLAPLSQDGRPLGDFANYFQRSDTKAILDIVGPETYPCQNNIFFAPLQRWIDEGSATLESAGTIGGGRKVWMTARLNGGIGESEIIKGDSVSRRLLFSGAFDRIGTQRIGFITHALSCSNQLARVHTNKTNKLLRAYRSQHVERNIVAIADIVNVAKGEFEADDRAYEALTHARINQKDLTTYVKRVFKMEENPETGKLATRTQNKLEEILRIHDRNTGIVQEMLASMQQREEMERETHEKLGASLLDAVLNNFEAGRSADVPGFRNNYWGAYNAVTEFLTYNQGRSAENRLDNNWFGTGAALNESALDIALEMAGAKSVA